MEITFASFDEVPSFKGASQHILAGLRGPARTHRVRLLSLGTTQLPDWEGFTHHPIALAEPNLLRRALLFRQRVTSLLATRPPDLVHVRSPWEGLSALRSGRPFVYEINGLPSVELRYHFRRVTEKTLAQLRDWENACAHGAAALLFPSTRVHDFCRRELGTDPAKMHVFENAFDPPPPRAPRRSRAPGPLRLVYLGTLSPWQGVFWALKALPPLGDAVTLDIFAPVSRVLWKHARRRIARLGLERVVRLHEPLHRGAMIAQLPTYDAGLAPLLKTERNTEQGCFPLKFLDYLAHGLPVIASDLFVSRQLVRDRENGFFFPPGDAASLTQLLAQLAANPATLTAMDERCRRSIDGHWTWDDYGRRLGALYETIASASR